MHIVSYSYSIVPNSCKITANHFVVVRNRPSIYKFVAKSIENLAKAWEKVFQICDKSSRIRCELFHIRCESFQIVKKSLHGFSFKILLNYSAFNVRSSSYLVASRFQIENFCNTKGCNKTYLELLTTLCSSNVVHPTLKQSPVRLGY